MTAILIDSDLDDHDRRKALFEGSLFVYSPRPSCMALVDFARQLVYEAFGNLDPRLAQYHLAQQEYVSILSNLKPKFINHPTSKRLVRDIIVDLGCDSEQTYLDVPRMRTATSDNYLTAGLAYAFHPHRDTWYSAPMCQINWWMPIFDIESGNSMAFHPRYWHSPVRNGSNEFNYDEYVQTARKDAAKYVAADTRKQPRPSDPIELDPQIRVVPRVGGLLLFSGAQLHSTVPNATGVTRFSIDFRTVHIVDVAERHGAPNIDSKCTGSSLRDFLRASDFERLPADLRAPYEHASPI
jgi:hypothetical protein